MLTASELWNRYRPDTRMLLMAVAIATVVALAGSSNPMWFNHSVPLSNATGPTSYVDREMTAMPASNSFSEGRAVNGAIGGVPGGTNASQIGGLNFSAREVTRTATLDLVTLRPEEDVERVRTIAERLHGYLVNSQIQASEHQSGTATLTIRVPGDRLDEARTLIKKLALSTELDRTDTTDVTKQYVDMSARLKNYRAEEAQYLTILKEARTVKDMLAVSEHLSEVRQEIEQLQGEFNYLAHQVEMASITVELRPQEQAQVFGIRWRPLYQSKLAVIDGLDALADYATNMLALLMRLPAILLWVGTVVFLAAVGWRLLKWLVALLLPVAKRIPARTNPA